MDDCCEYWPKIRPHEMKMNPQNYRHALEEGFSFYAQNHEDITRLEYLSDFIFAFTTYDTEMGELFARKAIEVCLAITNRTTFDYIKDKEQYQWFLIMVNMPFFKERLNWGTSVRGAFWDAGINSNFILDTIGLYLNGEIVEKVFFSEDEWRDFVVALSDFAMNAP